MIIGTVMVAAAIVIMFGVIHAGASGTLRKKNFRKNESLNPGIGNISTEELFAETTIATVDNW